MGRAGQAVTDAKRIPPNPPPRYDEVYWEGLAWLNSLDGPPMTEIVLEVELPQQCHGDEPV